MVTTFNNKLKLTPTSTAPSGTKGEMYYNSTDGLKVHDGSNWVNAGGRDFEDDDVMVGNSSLASVSSVSNSNNSVSVRINIPEEISQSINTSITIVSFIYSTVRYADNTTSSLARTWYKIDKIYNGVTTELVSDTQLISRWTNSRDPRDASDNERVTHTYTPTDDEKQNGFSIDVYGIVSPTLGPTQSAPDRTVSGRCEVGGNFIVYNA